MSHLRRVAAVRVSHRERARQSLQDLRGFHLETERRRHAAKKSRRHASYIFIETGIFLTGTKRENLASEVTELREAREKRGRPAALLESSAPPAREAFRSRFPQPFRGNLAKAGPLRFTVLGGLDSQNTSSV